MANSLTMPIKDPDAVLDYAIDWSDWLQSGETISTSAWTVQTGLTAGSTGNNGTIASIWLSGGTAGTTYTATNRITTNQGRTDDRTLRIPVESR